MIDSDKMDKSLDHDENKLGVKTSLSNLSNLSINLIGTSPGDNALNTNQVSLNEKVAQLANSIYTELEKIIKLYGKDIVKELMPIVVSVLEALDAAYHEKEELLVENELLRDDNDKLLLQYEREKQARKDTELKLFQSEDSFAEQKRDYEEKVKSLESIVRMIDLKSKNTSDHVLRLEEKENEIRREYNKLHERYTELFKTHCDYLERHKILFGQESHSSNTHSQNNQKINKSKLNVSVNSDLSDNSTGFHISKNKLLELLKSADKNINKSDLINCLKNLNQNDINSAVQLFLNQEISNSTQSIESSTVHDRSIQSSSTSLNQPMQEQISDKFILNASNNSASALTTYMECLENMLDPDEIGSSKLNLQSSDNFDEHLQGAEFDDTCSIMSQSNTKNSEYEADEDQMSKNDLSLFNELSRENQDITELDDGADLTGMTREVANLIRENSELLQTKHALNVLKDDLIVRLDQFSSEMLILREEIRSLQTVKAALQLKINELEEEQRKSKEELAAKNKKLEEEDESIPMSQRKRFTRAEMARVLMERNQFKEKLMELQEAVRWRETMRAIKQDQAEQDQSNHTGPEAHKKKSALSRFFSDLFGNSQPSSTSTSSPSPAQPSSSPKSTKTLKSKQNEQVVPLIDDPAGSQDAQPSEKILKAYEVLSPQETKSKKKELECREDGRMQAYGWSLPTSKNSSQPSNLTNVPVPVYCRPLFKEETNLRLSCAANVNYSFDPKCLPESINFDDLLKNSQFNSFRSDSVYKSSTIWICNLNDNDTHISIFDANKPGDLVQQFTLKSLKIHTLLPVSGVTKEDVNEKEIKPEETSSNSSNESQLATIQIFKNELNDNLDNITYIEVENDLNYSTASLQSVEQADAYILSSYQIRLYKFYKTLLLIRKKIVLNFLFIYLIFELIKMPMYFLISFLVKNNISEVHDESIKDFDDFSLDQKHTELSVNRIYESNNLTKPFNCTQSSHFISCKSIVNKLSIRKSLNDVQSVNSQQPVLSSVYPTLWLGSQEGLLLIHSTISSVNQTIDKVKLKDSILCMTQQNGKVLVGMADGSIAIFQRSSKTHEWDLKNFYTINFDNAHHSIRCIQSVYPNAWSGCRNKIYIFDPQNLTISNVIEVHPRKENQVRYLSTVDDGVWVSIRLDTTIRLYHAKTYQHLQNLDIEPFITKMLGISNLGLSIVRITSMTAANKRLWIGTGNGVVLSIPFNQSGQTPQCNINDSQFSFHGHRDAVKFFLSVPCEAIQKSSTDKTGKKYEKTETMLLLSGGHGYIDFRIGDTTTTKIETKKMDEPNFSFAPISKNDRSHLIVWQINEH